MMRWVERQRHKRFLAGFLHCNFASLPHKNFRCLQQLPFWLRNPSLILRGSLSGTYPWMSPATIWSRFQRLCWQIFSHKWLAQNMSIVLDQEETQRNRKFETRLVTGVLVGWAPPKKWFMLELLTWWTWKLDKRNFRISRKNGCRCFKKYFKKYTPWI